VAQRARERSAATLWGCGGLVLVVRWQILAAEAAGRYGGGHGLRRHGAGGSPTAPLAQLDAMAAVALAGASLLRWWQWVTPLSVLVVLSGDLLLRPLLARGDLRWSMLMG
jgi:hypothetical protein